MMQIATQPTIIKPEMLSIRQAAARGILPERAIRKLITIKKIPVVRSGNRQYINYTLLCEQLANGEGGVFE